jgi:hypothetical protein
LFSDGKKVSGGLITMCELGKKENWPLPLLSGLKSAIIALNSVVNFELLPPDLTQLHEKDAGGTPAP